LPDTIGIITVARLVKKKGIIYLLKAVELLLHRGVMVKCIVIGDGRLRKSLEKYVRKRKISNYIEFTGVQSRQKVLEYMRMSDVFVLPCIVDENGDRDGLPNVLLEAASMDIPVIATTISAIPEFVENEKTGLLANEKDENAIAIAILRLHQEPDLRRSLIKSAREKIQSDFDVSICTRRLKELFCNYIFYGGN
jgi:colanic acid/amylovoran biosynthesis glycosyltransferase